MDEMVPGAELESRASALALAIAANAPIAVERTLDAVNRGLDLPLDRALELEAEAFGACSKSEDMREGTAAFLAKRPPVWRGR
uniref:3-hydroxybutyryl-CoA dehydratase (Crotonase) n=1 Tax=mine drainage metagenome TaxID=410659 RepID=E6QHP3_9ZZZZ